MDNSVNIEEKIEVLSLDLFDTNMDEMEIIDKLQKHFDFNLGWHYCLDIAWIIREIKMLPKGALVLDAGAGSGLLQFILSEFGYNIISADFVGRSFSTNNLDRYRSLIYCLNSQQQTFDNRYLKHLRSTYGGNDIGKLLRLLGLFRCKEQTEDPLALIDNSRFTPREGASEQFLEGEADETCGRIYLYKCDLKEMSLLPDGLVDAVVSVSALEHNDHGDFDRCMKEMLRVTKPSGTLLITVSAALSSDWFHAPSKGWCYSEATLKKLFRLPEGVQSNFSNIDLLFQDMRIEGNQLHRRLAPVYYQSGENGMPWGKWDPKYLPVGILKVKV